VGDLDRVAKSRGQPLGRSGSVVLYGRVSSHRQRQEGGLERLREVAGDRPVAGEFFDVASGLSASAKGCGAL
jgi:predicted site-specific integrase-resolvase